MMNLLQSFAGGLCFAFGAFVGVALAGHIHSKRSNSVSELIAKNQKRIEDRLEAYTDALVTSTRAIENKLK